MPDRLFFPIAFLLAAGLVFLALLPAMDRKPSGSVSFSQTEADAGYQKVVIEGDQLYKIVAGGEAELKLVEVDGRVVLSIEAGAGLLGDDPLRGPHFRLAADIENVLSGKRIRVTVRARPGEVRGASEVLVNYSTGRRGESGWQRLALKPDWSEVRFTYDVPKREEEQGVDYFAIRPAVPDKTRSVMVDRVIIERIGEATP